MKKKGKSLGKKPATMKAMKKAKSTQKMSSKGGKKKLPPALQKAIDAKKAKKGGKQKMSYGKKKQKMSASKKKGMKMSITAKKPKVVKHKKKGRV